VTGFIIVLILVSSIRILREYQRGVIFMLGRFWKVKGPGLIIVIPGIQQMVRVGLRTMVLDVPEQDVISKDNVSVKVNAVVYYRVIDPQRAMQHELDEMLAERERLNADIQRILDEETDAWGIKVSNVELKHVDLDESMIRAIAKQAEAERERRAKVINAEGELQASHKMLEAGQILGQRPEAMQLRYLSAVQEIAGDRSNTIVFPLPVDFLSKLTGGTSEGGDRET
jgi:regulator of protease activity HflC (stomatin/prohibitin superfamily)